jgi:serine/threonine protein kinase
VGGDYYDYLEFPDGRIGMLVGDVAKVCDYGLVVTADADLTKTSNAFTPLYASPEAVGEQPVTGKSDQYSLAITYVELRTGHSPYASETAAAVYAAKETGKYDLSRIRSGAVRAVLKRALSPLPNGRFETCSEFIRELEKAEQSWWSGFWVVLAIAVVALAVLAAAMAVHILER